MSYCKNCGQPLADGAKFCHECGVAVVDVKTSQRETVYDGQIHKCPSCGEPIKSFEAICPSCGYEFRRTTMNSKVDELSKRLESSITEEQKIDLIKNFYIPNTKEDIYEFMILASTNINAGGYALDAWLVKLEQAYQKAKLSFGREPEFKYVDELYKKSLVKVKESRVKTVVSNKTFLIFIAMLISGAVTVIGYVFGVGSDNVGLMVMGIFGLMATMGLFVALLTTSNSTKEKKENARLERILFEVKQAMEKGDYKTAKMKASTVSFSLNNPNLKEKWDTVREELQESIDIATENVSHRVNAQRKSTTGTQSGARPFPNYGNPVSLNKSRIDKAIDRLNEFINRWE